MISTTRDEAFKNGHNVYHTGKPCKNGHISYRYRDSGTCYKCIHPDKYDGGNVELQEKRADFRKEQLEKRKLAEAKRATREWQRSMLRDRYRIHDVDLDQLRTMAWALAVMRFPTVTVADVDPNIAPTDRAAGTGMYAMYCHPDDEPALRRCAADLVSAHRVNAHAIRQHALDQAAVPPVEHPVNFK